MKGWFTADVAKVIEVISQYGRLRLIDDTELVVETDAPAAMESLANRLIDAFGEEVWIEPIPRTRLE